MKFLERGAYYEPDVARLMCDTVDEGDVVVDVGANAGFFTALLATLVGPRGKVVSFEPGENNLPRLKNNIALNQLANVALIEKPASDSPGAVSFFINSDDSGGNALWDPATFAGNVETAARPQAHTLQATTIDAEFERLSLPPPKLIKIDTEGAELKVLEGCRRLLKNRKVPFVVTEYHPFGLEKMGASPEALRGFMETLGYSTFALYYDGAMPRLIPPGTEITIPCFVNVLFSTPENVGRYYRTYFHHPGMTHPKQ
jgi:FkbM family methyltransferase